MNESHRQLEALAQRLDWATSAPPPAGEPDAEAQQDREAAQWREAWVALGRHLESDAPPFDPDTLLAKLQAELAPSTAQPVATPQKGAAPADPPRGAWWLAIAGGVLALLAGGWWVVRQLSVTNDVAPGGATLAEEERKILPQKNNSPIEKPSPPAVVQGEKKKEFAPEKVTPEQVAPSESPPPEDLASTAWDDSDLDEALTQVKTQVYSVDVDWNASRAANRLDSRLQELEKEVGGEETQ